MACLTYRKLYNKCTDRSLSSTLCLNCASGTSPISVGISSTKPSITCSY